MISLAATIIIFLSMAMRDILQLRYVLFAHVVGSAGR